MADHPFRTLPPDNLAPLLAMIRQAFAYMDGRIDPPSSIHRLSLRELERMAVEGEVWQIGQPPQACVVLTIGEDVLHLGKLAVAEGQRRHGLGRALVGLAETRARALRLSALALQVRVELTEALAFYESLGFVPVARTAHPGYDRPTSITLRKMLGPATP